MKHIASKTEKIALIVSAITAFLLAMWGISMGVYIHSDAILLDGLFNLLSGVLALFGVYVSTLLTRGYTKKYPLGYFTYEPLLILIKGILILGLVSVAILSNIATLLAGGNTPKLYHMLVYTLPALIICLSAWGFIHYMSKKYPSDILKAETLGWKLNTLTTATIGMALLCALALEYTFLSWIIRYVDQILVIALSLLFIKEPFLLIRNSLQEFLGQNVANTTNIHTLLEQYKTEEMLFTIHEHFLLKTGPKSWLYIILHPKQDNILLKEYFIHIEALKTTVQEQYPNTDVACFIEEIK